MPFRAILETLVATHSPAVRAAIFCDSEGERVAAVTGDLDSFDLDVLGASLALPASQMRQGTRARFVVDDQVVWVLVVDLGCYLVVSCLPGLDLVCRRDFPTVADALVAQL